jgi:periplasmic copper chaperone A
MLRRTFLLAFFAPAFAEAHSFRHGNIAIGHAWALPRQLADGQVFFPMAIKGERDELVAARSSVCTYIQLRENNRYDDPPLSSIKLEPGKPIPMRPTATHLRLVGMKQLLKVGDRFKIILDFLNSGEVEIEVFVEEKPGD